MDQATPNQSSSARNAQVNVRNEDASGHNQTGCLRPFKRFQRVLNRNVQLRFRKHLCIHVAIEKHLDVGGRAVGRGGAASDGRHVRRRAERKT